MIEAEAKAVSPLGDNVGVPIAKEPNPPRNTKSARVRLITDNLVQSHVFDLRDTIFEI